MEFDATDFHSLSNERLVQDAKTKWQNRRQNKLKKYRKSRPDGDTAFFESSPPQFLDIENTCEQDL
jgi:hypothetical protein